MTDERMTKGEREDLQRLIRQREKVQKSAAKARSTELLADFENQIAAEYRFDDDAVWASATKAAEAEVAKAQERVAIRCQELGIPKQFAPGLRLAWAHRGYDNALDKRRAELRRVARAQVESLEQQAIVKIEQASVEAQTQIAVAGLTSGAALSFVASLPSVESLMPALSYRELAGEADPPIVEQLIAPNALRQRRFRDRQKALRHADVTSRDALPEGSAK
jgi:hypothetical protein